MNFSTPKIMGVLNVTPDSFSDGGQFIDPKKAVERAREMIAEGADIIDVGAESTGPDSKDVGAEEELRRLAPVIEALAEQGLTEKALFSIDTYKAPVAEFALFHGFRMVNDVTSLRGDPELLNVLLKYDPYVILMFAKDPTPRTTREDRQYVDVMDTVKQFLHDKITFLKKRGVPAGHILIDPGMGLFLSADPKVSFEIIDRLDELTLFNCPIVVGVSRKSFLGGELKDRDAASVQWSLKAIQNGASVVRMHEVSAMRLALGHS